MTEKNSTSLIQHIGVVWFALMAIGALAWFLLIAIETSKQLIATPESISFEKGVFYLLGVGISLGALLAFMLIEVIKKKPPTDHVSKKIGRVALLGVVLMLLLPHAVQYGIENYLEPKGYGICDSASYQWLHHRIIVYTNNAETCIQLSKLQ